MPRSPSVCSEPCCHRAARLEDRPGSRNRPLLVPRYPSNTGRRRARPPRPRIATQASCRRRARFTRPAPRRSSRKTETGLREIDREHDPRGAAVRAEAPRTHGGTPPLPSLSLSHIRPGNFLREIFFGITKADFPSLRSWSTRVLNAHLSYGTVAQTRPLLADKSPWALSSE